MVLDCSPLKVSISSFSSYLIDINECSGKSHGCHIDADCINTPGNYTCQCKSGFGGSGTQCKGTDSLFNYVFRQIRTCVVFQCGESYPLQSTAEAIVLKPRPIPMPAEIGYSLRRGRGGSLDCMWGVQTHRGPPVFSVPSRKDLARMNGTPRPNQK